MKTLAILGLSFNFIGAIILAVGLVKTKNQIEKESDTYWDQNPHLKFSMYKDRKATILGISIMAIGFLMSLICELIK